MIAVVGINGEFLGAFQGVDRGRRGIGDPPSIRLFHKAHGQTTSSIVGIKRAGDDQRVAIHQIVDLRKVIRESEIGDIGTIYIDELRLGWIRQLQGN